MSRWPSIHPVWDTKYGVCGALQLGNAQELAVLVGSAQVQDAWHEYKRNYLDDYHWNRKVRGRGKIASEIEVRARLVGNQNYFRQTPILVGQPDVDCIARLFVCWEEEIFNNQTLVPQLYAMRSNLPQVYAACYILFRHLRHHEQGSKNENNRTNLHSRGVPPPRVVQPQAQAPQQSTDTNAVSQPAGHLQTIPFQPVNAQPASSGPAFGPHAADWQRQLQAYSVSGKSQSTFLQSTNQDMYQSLQSGASESSNNANITSGGDSQPTYPQQTNDSMGGYTQSRVSSTQDPDAVPQFTGLDTSTPYANTQNDHDQTRVSTTQRATAPVAMASSSSAQEGIAMPQTRGETFVQHESAVESSVGSPAANQTPNDPAIMASSALPQQVVAQSTVGTSADAITSGVPSRSENGDSEVAGARKRSAENEDETERDSKRAKRD